MTKAQIINVFISKGILTIGKGNRVKRKFCWKKNFDSEAQKIWNSFSSKYRSDNEAWFCLSFQTELPICPLCGIRKVKFTGLTKNGAPGFNTTCEVCNNANAVPEKRERVRKTYLSHSKEQKDEINRKKRESRKKKY